MQDLQVRRVPLAHPVPQAHRDLKDPWVPQEIRDWPVPQGHRVPRDLRVSDRSERQARLDSAVRRVYLDLRDLAG